jgi:peptidoglycan/xylan/chitin deacetylase (PgdA/CDA1 family)
MPTRFYTRLSDSVACLAWPVLNRYHRVMRLHVFIVAVVVAASFHRASAQAPTIPMKSVAITIDDLPFVTAEKDPLVRAKSATIANRKLLTALARHHVPVTGFVNEKGVEDLQPVGSAILRDWVHRGFDLGNHTYAHRDFNDLTIAQFEDEIVRGEKTYLPLMDLAHRDSKFYRFPFNHAGDTKERHDAVAAFLKDRGYRTAPCTIETEDWMFASKYVLMLTRHDDAAAVRLRKEYLAFTAAKIDFFTALDKQVLGYDAPQIMLIHDNPLNADVIDDIIAIFKEKQYRFVTLAEAEADPAYKTPETFITKSGMMWGYRWARERNVKVDGSKEPEPPAWITAYGEEPQKK